MIGIFTVGVVLTVANAARGIDSVEPDPNSTVGAPGNTAVDNEIEFFSYGLGALAEIGAYGHDAARAGTRRLCVNEPLFVAEVHLVA